MINSTALKNPAFLAKIGAAMREAVRRSDSALSIAVAAVYNRRGTPAVHVVHRRGTFSGFEFFDSADRDITAQVIATLRQHGAIEAAQ